MSIENENHAKKSEEGQIWRFLKNTSKLLNSLQKKAQKALKMQKILNDAKGWFQYSYDKMWFTVRTTVHNCIELDDNGWIMCDGCR